MVPTIVPQRSSIVLTCLIVVIAVLAYRMLHELPTWGDGITMVRSGLLLAALLVESLLLLCMYRLTFHPLARYPGPWAAAITDWYTVYHCLVGDRHLDFYRLHQKHGPIVRFGPNRVSVNSNTALRDVYGVNANTQKSQVYAAFGHFFKVPATMTTIDKKTHAFKRRVTVRALTNNSVKNLEELMLRNIRIFCRLLLDESSTQGWNSAKNLTKMISFVLSDIMGDVTFSRNWNTQRSDENRYILNLLPLGTGGINLSGHMPILLKLKLDKLFFPKLVRGTYQFQALSKSQSDWRASQVKNETRQDLFAALLEAKDPETNVGYTNEELVAEAGILIVAGSDTTATTVTSTVFYLLHYPSALSRIQDEVRSKFGEVEEIRIGTQLTSCSFLFACIDEAMRLSPAVGALLPREILQGGLVIESEHFPQGIDIGVPSYCIHHEESYFPEPFTFKPQRWLLETENPEAAIALARSAFCPFGVGRTSCVGKYLAYQEMAIMIVRMVWLYDMRLQPDSTLGEGYLGLGYGRGRKEEFQLYDKFVSTHDGPLVEFRRRLQ